MSSKYLRHLGVAAGTVLMAAAPIVVAQVRVQITTAPVNGNPPTNCTMTTDVNGISLVEGSTDLRATGVTFDPAGCGVSVIPAPSPANFALTAPGSATVGTPFTVSWSVTNAATCTGSASLDGSSANLSGWTTSTSATSPRTVTATQAGTYQLSLVCSNAAVPPSSVTSQTATVTVTSGGGGGSCQGPAGLTRLTQSNITYGAVNLTARPNVDVTEWNNIWGHATTADPITPWPGVNGAGPVVRQFGRTTFIAAHFNTGSHGEPDYGVLAYASNIGGPNVDIRISQTCGDFSANAANPGCLVQAASDDSPAIRWKFGTGNTTSYCNLQPNSDYYINIKYHDPTSAVECPASSPVCPFYTVSNGNW